MKILVSSHFFHPSIGGIESVTEILALEFAKLGHKVRILTQTQEPGQRQFPFEVVRRPSVSALFAAVNWCDLFFQNNISLQTAWPLLFLRRPWVIAHHTWIARTDGTIGWQDRLKRMAMKSAASISISGAVAASLPVKSTVIPDPYRNDLFQELPGATHKRQLIFVGRLVSDKGVNVLIEALGRLREEGLAPHLTIVGTGPELPRLQEQAVCTGVSTQVDFAGAKSGMALVELLNAHQILVVPSIWQEPFGMVALEGIACGCVVVGSCGGGLPEAIGPCGMTVPNGDAPALAHALSQLLTGSERQAAYRANAPAHLKQFRREPIAERYLKVMAEAVKRDQQNAR
jgi:glycogen(starch) synthase